MPGLGDTRQVDNPYLSEANNGLNWIVRKLKGQPNYAHIVLKGDRSRGPITDLVQRAPPYLLAKATAPAVAFFYACPVKRKKSYSGLLASRLQKMGFQVLCPGRSVTLL